MGIRAFGSISVEGPAGPVDLTGARERAVLGLLIAHVGRVVSDDVLVDVLWGHDVDPDSARKSLRVRVSGVRRALSSTGATVERAAGGYRLIAEPADIDIVRFRMAAARTSTRGPAEDTAAAADDALAEWVDEPFAELRYVDALTAVRSELEEIRRAVVAARTRALIDLGRAADAVPAVVAALEEAPEDETLARAAMRALAAAGRSNEALGVFDRLSTHLAERGLEPSPETRALERDVLGEPLVARAVSEQSTVRYGVPDWDRPIGRDVDVDSVVGLAASERVISILGPGGIGKTRVAAAVARAISGLESVWWVPLHDAVASEVVMGRIARALGATRWGSDPLEDAIVEAIGSERALLILDNADRSVAACRQFVEVAITRCPRLVVLVTSQAPLGLRTERRVRLTPISLPPPEVVDPAVLGENPAVRLFVRAAERSGAPPVHDLSEVAALVRALEGMPLAIELAAAQSDLYTPSEMLDRFRVDPETLEGGDAPGPVGSARWSIALLEPEERHLLADLAVLPGDFPPRVAEAIGATREATRRLRALVDRSLLEVTPSGAGARLHLLDSVRAATPPPDDPDVVGARLLETMRHLASRLTDVDAPTALTEITTEIRLFDAAFRHALETAPEAAVELASRLGWYWSRHGDWTVGASWYDAVLDLDLDGMDPELTMPVLKNAGVLALFAGRESARAEAIFSRLDAIALRSGRRRPFNDTSPVHSYRGHYEQAIALLELQVAQDAETGHDASTPLANLAHLHLECGRLDRAAAYIHLAGAEAFRQGTATVTHTALIEAQLWAKRGEATRARDAAVRLLERWRAFGANLDHQVNALHLLAELAMDADDLPAAAQRLRDANHLLAAVDRELPHHLLLVGEIARRTRRRAEADALASAALSRMGDDEVLFPGRRRFLPPDAVRGPSQRRATLLSMTADVIAGAIVP